MMVQKIFSILPIPDTHAQVPDLPDPGVETYPLGFILKFYQSRNLIGNIISAFLPAILGIAGFITVIVIVISGIQFILSSGNPEAAASAKNRLIFALVGFGLIILAFAITQIIDRLFLNSGAV